MATLVHDDLIDRAHFRRGKAAAWSVYGADAARATGDYLFARAFAELTATGDAEAVSDARRRDALRSRAARRSSAPRPTIPSTTVEAYIERCALKTGALFEAACSLGGGSGEYGVALGVAFQIADDVLDCAGVDDRDGKDRRHRPPRRDADAAAPARRRGGRRRPRRARRRPARRRARARCRDRCARTLPRGCAGLRYESPGVPQRGAAPRRARVADARGRQPREIEGKRQRGSSRHDRHARARSARRSKRASAWTSRTGSR